MNVAAYVRVSTRDQVNDGQADLIREWAKKEGVTLTMYEEKASAGAKRPVLVELVRDAQAGKFAALVCVRLDRVGRSLGELISLVDTLREAHVDVIFLKEQFDTRTPAGRMVFHVTAVFAQYERDLLRERTREGMAAARARGNMAGRPSTVDKARVLEMHARGATSAEISAALGIAASSVRSVIGRSRPMTVTEQLRAQKACDAAKRALAVHGAEAAAAASLGIGVVTLRRHLAYSVAA